MSLKSIFSKLAKNMDKQRANEYRKHDMREIYKHRAIDYSDRYFDLEKVGNDYEWERIYDISIYDLEEKLNGHKFVAEKWMNITNQMKLLPVPDLPSSEAKKLFIDSHDLLIQSSTLRSQINLMEAERIEAELEDNYTLSRGLDSRINEIRKLDSELQETFRNVFDDLLYYLNNSNY